ncbi:MAG TPA: histidine kinase dimerization/phospho-acceptor domain-containing protein, partial [Bradyrhizobium sp.]|nr:histidine kinase dimerization/phospho-acceptor domain-containing protein [Bradyrhizobium sp.]
MSTLAPLGACLDWNQGLISLNAASDGMTACAFLTTAFVLGLFVWRRRRDLIPMFRIVFPVFALFVALSGVNHLEQIVTLWVPVYSLEALTKGILALISLAITAIMVLMLPKLLVMPTRVQIQQAYAALEEEVRQRQKAEAMVRRFQESEANEAKVRQAQKMEAVGQLTGGVAHDFNNILTVITGTIEILASAVEKEPQLAAITRMIDEAAARGADLTQHLLAFARRQPLQPREI